jgi:hypothetical protein
LIAVGEILNGNLRVRILNGKFGDRPAKKISLFTGLFIIYTIAWLSMPWLDPKNLKDCFLIGFTWMMLMLGLDIYVGRFVFRFPWRKILEDFDIRKGNLLGLGMLLLFLCPTILFIIKK